MPGQMSGSRPRKLNPDAWGMRQLRAAHPSHSPEMQSEQLGLRGVGVRDRQDVGVQELNRLTNKKIHSQLAVRFQIPCQR